MPHSTAAVCVVGDLRGSQTAQRPWWRPGTGAEPRPRGSRGQTAGETSWPGTLRYGQWPPAACREERQVHSETLQQCTWLLPDGDGNGGLLGSVSLVLSGPTSHHHVTIAQLLCCLRRESGTTPPTDKKRETPLINSQPLALCTHPLQNVMNFLSVGRSSSPSEACSVDDCRAFK